MQRAERVAALDDKEITIVKKPRTVEIVVEVVNMNELAAAFSVFGHWDHRDKAYDVYNVPTANIFVVFGRINSRPAALMQTTPGTHGTQGSAVITQGVLPFLQPKLVFGVGVGFGTPLCIAEQLKGVKRERYKVNGDLQLADVLRRLFSQLF